MDYHFMVVALNNVVTKKYVFLYLSVSTILPKNKMEFKFNMIKP